MFGLMVEKLYLEKIKQLTELEIERIFSIYIFEFLKYNRNLQYIMREIIKYLMYFLKDKFKIVMNLGFCSYVELD